MLSIYICDDQREHLLYIRDCVKNALNEDADFMLFSSAHRLLDQAISKPPDIAIIDMCMDDMDGIALAQHINNSIASCSIIFVTGYITRTPFAYDAEHVYLVMKDQLRERIGIALQKAISTRESQQLNMITVKCRTSTYILPVRDLLYMERIMRKTRVVFKDRELLTGHSPSQLITPELSDRIIRCHNSFWVNLACVSNYSRTCFTMSNGQTITISRGFHDEAKAAFFAHLSPVI